MDCIERLYGNATPAAEADEIAFRHSGWRSDRKRVAVGLAASGTPERVLERFAVCGSEAIVEYSATLKRHRIKAFYCGHRCCRPCANAKARKTTNRLVCLCRNKRTSFVTFTLRGSQASVTDCLNHLYESFQKLRRCKLWLEAVDGGCVVPEVKRGAIGGLWHVHLHGILLGRFIDQAALSRAWHKATGDSFIVHIRRIKDDAREIGYVAAYAGKGFDRSVVVSPDDLIECICSLRGRRLLIPFGCWHGLDVESDKASADDWKRVGRLGHIVRDGYRNEPYAIGVLLSLKVWMHRDEEGFVFGRIDHAEKG